MNFLEKIPPLVSALAFGYGVGMAAPEVPHGVRSPFTWNEPVETAGPRRPAVQPLKESLENRLPGGESDALRELRSQRVPSRYGLASNSRFEEQGSHGGQLRDERRVEDEDLEQVDDFEASGGAAVSRLQLPDLGLGVSRQTLKYVRFFTKTDRGRGMFESWLKRSGRYQDMIQEEFRARRLPEDLIWVAMIESGFDATAKSPVGAMGLWQFMPATGAVYGLRQNKFVDQRRNPRLATQAAVHHLRDLYMRFGQWDLALAAYNMGYEQLLDRIDRVGTTDFNELARAGVLPDETAKYVPKIIAAAIVANNLERFDFDETSVAKPVDMAEIAVPPRTPLDVIAKAAGVPTAVIRKLNPDILGKEMPPGKGDLLVNVPPETVSRAVAAMPAMLDGHKLRIDEDMVDPLDLMSPEGYRPRAAESDESLLSLLPKPKKKRRALRDPLAEGLEGIAALENEGLDASDDVEPAPKKKSETVLYRVGKGDKIEDIARQFEADPAEVARDNDLTLGSKLKEGTLLRLTLSKPPVAAKGEERSRKAKRRSNG
jgi:membrane-bound lytic murein transglycosylase D